MADVAEVLFSSDATGGITAWDPRAGTALQSYKGAVVAARTLCLLGQDYVLGAEAGKSLLRAWPLNRNDQGQLKMVSPGGPVSALACSPCGNFIAGGVHSDVVIWQTGTGLQVASLRGHFQKVSCLAFTDDSSLLASSAEDGHVRVHRLAAAVSGKTSELWTFQDHGGAIRDMVIGRGGLNSLLASVAADRTCRVYSLASGRLLLSLTADCSVTAAAISIDCIYLGLSSGQIRGHRLAAGLSTPRLTLNGHESAVICLTISFDGRLLASGGQDGHLYIWDAPSGQMLRNLAHRGPVVAAVLTLAPRNLLAADMRPTVVLQPFRRPLADDEEVVVKVLVTEKEDEPEVELEPLEANGRGVPEGSAAKINKQLVEFCVKNILQPKN
ncbi:WD repeat-containing protein 18 [Neocloeon triangulifer]|uniref:WD repeat-containing protein 18 n=1 Tax=Neocloeon triangulifer TaxID=2078957 RepID=UPI00286EF490|nr:WD repeat-containing protein 18 [Neocloeon triangulifer]